MKKDLIAQFKSNIKTNGRNYKWFLREYLPNMDYHAFASQINGYNPIYEKVEKAIEKYLEESR